MSLLGFYDVKKMVILALLFAAGTVLYILESLYFPVFLIPGIKLGITNIVTLILVVFFSWRDCVFNAMARTIVGSLVTGSFFTPAFLFSLSGALVSTIIMLIMYKFFYGKFSLVGISVAGAVSHNATQLFLAEALFIKHWGIILQAPILILAAVMTGAINGVIANLFAERAISIPEFENSLSAKVNLRRFDERF